MTKAKLPRAPNPWVDRWLYCMPSTRDHIRRRQHRVQRAPLEKVIATSNDVETYECGHVLPAKKDPAGQVYRAVARRCLECLRVDEDYGALLVELRSK